MDGSSKNYLLTKKACYLTSAAGGVPAMLSPLLFTTFHRVYDISYTLLGFLVVINFSIQLFFDLIYSFFSSKLNIKISAKMTPLLTVIGLLVYSSAPVLFPKTVYIGLALGTAIFAAGGGLAEVLTNPIITAIPSENTAKDLSALHSCYAWGSLGVVSVSALFIHFFGGEMWQLLAVSLMILPLTATVLMLFAPIPKIASQKNITPSDRGLNNKTVMFYVICIFFAGASELTMCEWCSGYLETVFGIDKTAGDLLGLAMFSATLGIGRTIYTKFGNNIDFALIFGSLGAAVCYAAAALTDSGVVGLLACAVTGFFVSMLWPGSIIALTERVPDMSVGIFALAAVGGDLGATFYPQLIGIITDKVMLNSSMIAFGERIGLTAEQLGMKTGMSVAAIAPLLGALLFWFAKKQSTKTEKT